VIGTILALRIALFIYCISERLAKGALFFMYAILMPMLSLETVIGQIYYKEITDHPECVSFLTTRCSGVEVLIGH
jgi:hypothetical protein